MPLFHGHLTVCCVTYQCAFVMSVVTVVIPHDDVINELAADTLSNSTSLGTVNGKRFFCGYFSSLASLSLKVEFDKYMKGVHWLKDLLYGVQFSVERIRIVANKMLNDVAKLKRSGQKIAETLMRAVTYKEGQSSAVSYACGYVLQCILVYKSIFGYTHTLVIFLG